jgi:GT2 family glycosyltransferase
MQILVCVLSYNHPDLTERALSSALRFHSFSEIALLHNGSETTHVQRLNNKFPHIQHWVLDKNRGFTGGVNEIFRRAYTLTPWVFLLTNDCELLSRAQLSDVNRPPSLLGTVAWTSRKGEQRGKIDSFLGKVNLASGHLTHFKSKLEMMAPLTSSEKYYVPGAAFFLHRDIFTQAGGWDESLETYWEDVEYSLRLQQAGLLIGIEELVEINHKVGKTCHRDPYYTSYLYQRNRRLVSLRYCANGDRLLLRWNLFRSSLKTIYFHCRRRRWKHLALFFRAIWH